jgi:ribosomal small subunit protein bTHX
MGKGDRKTTKGKRIMGSHGNTRPRKSTSNVVKAVVEAVKEKPVKKAVAEKVSKPKVEKAVKAAVEKEVKAPAKKAPAKKAPAKKAE